jgi:Secretion system C-terminal sorting domain
MKKFNLLLIASAFSNCIFAQTINETPNILEDSIYSLADSVGNGINWNFDSFDLNNYPNTSDSDLVQRLNPKTLYVSQNEWLTGTTLTGALPTKEYSEDGLTLSLVGSYSVTKEGSGAITIPGQTFENVDKIKWVENYLMLFEGDTLATYSNTYFSYFKQNTKHKVFEVFKKQRSLGGNTNFVFYGVSDCITCPNNGALPDIDLLMNPNPASNETTISYNLWKNSTVNITITNQAGNVNNVLYSAQDGEGENSHTFLMQNYVTGLYTIHVTIDDVSYSLNLIVQ